MNRGERIARWEVLLWTLAIAGTRLLAWAGDADALHRVDELYAGAAALEILAGRGGDLSALAWDPYSGGSLLVILALVPLMWLLGSGLWVLKSLAMVTTGLTAAIWIAMISRAWGKPAARFAALLFCFAPPMAARLGLMAWGNHAETALPTAIALYSLQRLLDPETRPGPRAVHALAIGFFASLAVFVSLMGVIAWIVIAVVLALAKSPGWWSQRGRMGLGAGLGFLPALWLAGIRGGDAVSALGSAMRPQLGLAPIRAWNLLTIHVPDFLGEGVCGAGATLIAVMGIAIAVNAIVRRRDIEPVVIAVAIGPLSFAIGFAFSGFSLGPVAAGVIALHYLAPITPFVVAAMTNCIVRLPRGLGYGLLTLVLVPGAALAFRSIGAGNPVPIDRVGFSYSAFGWHLLEECDRDYPSIIGRIAAIADPRHRAAAAHGVAIGFSIDDRIGQWATHPEEWVPRLNSLLDRATPLGPVGRSIAVRAGLILSTGDRPQLPATRIQSLVTGVVTNRDPELIAPILNALFASADDLHAARAIADQLEGKNRESALEGIGRALARSGGPPSDSGLSANDRDALTRGRDFELMWRRLTATPARPAPDDLVSSGANAARWLFDPDDDARRRAR